MKIVSWNCCGKFREKYKNITYIDADIYVIQECENPKYTKNKDYKIFSENCIWVGENKNKGLGVFAKREISLKNNNWKSFCLQNFLCVKINNKFNLLAVWACNRHIEEYYIYQSIHEKKYNNDMLIIGDFNSNSMWDSKHNKRTHSSVVSKLESIGLKSAYHTTKGETQGCESEKTFYLYRHLDKSYHIDYAFLKQSRIRDFKILESNEWLNYSDHKPIYLEI